MSKKTKKVVLFLVEGVSEETALGLPMKNYFETNEVKFEVVHGDITTMDGVDSGTIIKHINTRITNYMSKYGYKNSDILRIIHIVDTDGAFISADSIVLDESISLDYSEDCIRTSAPVYIKARNESKSKILFKLFNTYSINTMKYNVYFNSCNLEHVLVGELCNFSDAEKERIADDFSDKYCEDIEGFRLFLKSVLPKEQYIASWKFIKEGKNSLKRYSNMSLIFGDEERGR